MKPLFQLLIQVILTLTLTLCRKDGDEGRPYEFGFTIEGQQHRHEKKDENGIIQGEFGFITADGIYHVTVYATDENGNFKILSMKNIRISAPLDGSAATGPISPEANKYLKSPKASESPPVQSSSRPQPLQSQRLVQPNPIQEVVTATPKPQLIFTTKPTIKPACGGCGYVTTPKPTSRPQIENQVILQSHPIGGSLQSTNTANQASPDVELLPPGFRADNVGPSTNFQPSTHVPSDEYQQLSGQMQNAGNQGDVVYRQQQTPNAQSITSVNGTPSTDLLAPHLDISYNEYKQDSGQIQYPGNQQEAIYEQQQNQYSQPLSQVNNDVFTSVNRKQVANIQTDHLASLGNQTNQKEYVEIVANLPETAEVPNLADRFNQLNLPPTSNEASKLPPITVSDDSIHVGGRQPQDIPIQDKFPGMVDGLPDGIEEKDITNILYKFKYTVGFHGHYETGLKDGTKIGGYFVNGRDGFSRVVTYVADENGYRPKFKLVNLGLDSPDTPKEDTEKTFGLKSFEFVWYPIN